MQRMAMAWRQLALGLVGGLLWLAAVPAGAQAPRMQELLSGREFPLTLKLKELDGEWRRISVGGPLEAGGRIQGSGGLPGNGTCDTYYTRGVTVTAGGETYLVAYQACRKPGGLAALVAVAAGEDEEPVTALVPELLTPDTSLALSLLNIRTVGSLSDVRGFNLDQELADNRKARQAVRAADGVSSQTNLNQLGLALLMYARDHEQRFPPMRDAATVRPMLMPYLKNDAVFTHPETRAPYQPNPLLSNRTLAQVVNPAETVAFFEAAPAADRTRGVTFVDGHVQRLPEEGWQPLQQELAAGLRREETNAASLANLAALGKALVAYLRDHDGTLPELRDGSALPPLLAPYGAPEAAFARPDTSDGYLPNRLLSRKKLAQFKSPAQTVVLFEARPAEDGWHNATRAVIFLDGRAKRLSEDEWRTLKAKLKIP
jgi:hypothetical protein